MGYKLQYSRYNASSILIEWPAIIDDFILKDVLNFKNSIQNYYIEQNIEVISTYSSILITYSFTIDIINNEILNLKSLYSQQTDSENLKSSLWNIPVCYDDEFGMDLENFSNKKNLSKPEIIKIHTEAIYTVYFIGFLPGFLYLGGLDPKLHLDRKTTPNLNVKKGAVGIGGQQTGIYPQDSPGGWHIIGNSPIELFTTKSNPPCFVEAGDKIQFQSIDSSQYNAIKKEIEHSKFNLKSLKV